MLEDLNRNCTVHRSGFDFHRVQIRSERRDVMQAKLVGVTAELLNTLRRDVDGHDLLNVFGHCKRNPTDARPGVQNPGIRCQTQMTQCRTNLELRITLLCIPPQRPGSCRVRGLYLQPLKGCRIAEGLVTVVLCHSRSPRAFGALCSLAAYSVWQTNSSATGTSASRSFDSDRALYRAREYRRDQV